MRRVRRAATVGQVVVALIALHLLARDAVAAAVALAPNANGVVHSKAALPAELAGYAVRDLGRVPAARSRSLAGWLVEPRGARRSATIVLLHGVRTDSSLLGAFAQDFAQAGYTALLVDLPGHGRSAGRFLGYGRAEAREVERFIDELQADAVLQREPLGVFGFSYGGAVAVELAAMDPRVNAVVAVSAFASVRQVMSDYRAKYLPRPLALVPDSWFQGAVDEAATIAGFDPERGPLSAASHTTMPILYMHGAADDQVPSEHSRRLARATPRGELMTVPGLGHAAMPHDAIVRRHASEWFQRWLP